MTQDATSQVVIIGGGPAGLSCAIRLAENAVVPIVLEKDEHYVGGIARTVEYKGYRFDIGGHRFFSKSDEIEAFWKATLGEELMECRRLSRIHFRGKFFDYPLRLGDALPKLGLWYSFLCCVSYLKARLAPRLAVISFEDWIVNNFGERLFNTFFKTYTEKVWGIPCENISKDWAAQRIKGLSIVSLLRNVLVPQTLGRDKTQIIKTLIDSFRYPRLGPGQLWEQVAENIQRLDGTVLLGQDVVALHCTDNRVSHVISTDRQGNPLTTACDHLVVSMPMRDFILSLTPPPPPEIIATATQLKYRDFLIVTLIIDAPDLFPDNWLYIHDDSVSVGRIQNFKNWSMSLVADPQKTCLGMEYFCNDQDELWNKTDATLILLATQELESLGLLKGHTVSDGHVVRMPKAYPVYDHSYADRVATIRKFVEDSFSNVQLIGRNGMHRYNNQDHAMMTGFLAAQNILSADYTTFDLWRVNDDAYYHEEQSHIELRQHPQRVGE